MSRQINVATEFKTIYGKPMIQKIDGEDFPLTLKSVLVNALLNPEEKLTGEQKLARFNLAQGIYASAGEFTFSETDVILLKKLVNDLYPTLIVGRVYQLLGD